MSTLCIRTNGGKTYYVDLETGNISYNNMPASGQWKFLGFDHVKRSEFISIATIRSNPAVLAGIVWIYKTSGNGQYIVRDNDHGTERQWVSHRVFRAWIEAEDQRARRLYNARIGE